MVSDQTLTAWTALLALLTARVLSDQMRAITSFTLEPRLTTAVARNCRSPTVSCR